jgi:opacity protein-like surface antigen
MNAKRIKGIALIVTLSLLTSCATDTAAQDFEYSLGVALQKSNSKSSAMFTQGPWATQLPITTPNLNVPGLGIFGGAKITENFAVEAGVSFAKKATEVNDRNNTVTVTSSNLYMDAVGVMPIGLDPGLSFSEGFSLRAKAGVGLMNTTISVDNENMINEDNVNKAKVGVRLGVGTQYRFSSNLALTADYTWQQGNTDGISSANTTAFGVSWNF